MADDSLPPLVTRQTTTPAPLEGQDVPTGEGMQAQYGASFMGTLGVSLAAHTQSGGATIPHDEAVKTMKSNGYDASVLPNGEVSQGYLDAVMGQQSQIARDRDMAARAHLGGATQFISSFAGSMSDPLFLALGPVGKLLQGARAVAGLGEAAEGATLAVRAVKGAAEGGAIIGGYETAQKFAGTGQGDRDITTMQIVHDATIGALLGGTLGAAFGARAKAPADVSSHVDMIRYAENTAGYAKARGISVNDVVSRTGAIGEFQIEPNTARQYMGKDFDVSTLKAPAVNQAVAEKIIRDLDKRFKGDPEAVAVAYNAGPGVAQRFVRAGHDRSMLPAETRGYLQRIDQMKGRESFGVRGATPDAQEAAAKTAVLQASNDSTVHVDPILDSVKAEKSGEPVPATNDLSTAIPKAGSIITDEQGSAAMLERVNGQATAKAPPQTEGSIVSPETAQLKQQSTDAIAEAEHAHTMANGVPTPREAEGIVRMYHGGAMYEKGHPLWFTSHLPKAEGYADKSGGKVQYIDMPENHPLIAPEYPEQSVKQGFTAEREMPKDFSDRRQPFIKPNDDDASPLKTALANDDEAIANESTLAKAIDAAVRCSVIKGA